MCTQRTTLFILVALCLSVFKTSAYAQSQRQEAREERPNILLALADDASFPHFSAYGIDWVETPAFDRVAREGLLFNRAYTPNSKCAPSRAALLTGRNSWQLGAAANHEAYFPQRFITYAEALSTHGYFYGHTGKPYAPGVARTEDGERRYLPGPPFEKYTVEPPTKEISNNDYAANFRYFLKEKPEDQPFVFWYGGHEPHRPYEYNTGRRQGGKHLKDIDEVPPFLPDNDTVRTDMLDYAFEIEYFDRQLGKMLQTLEARGELENTLVVVTADQGMPFPRMKGQEYEGGVHVPLAIMWGAGIKNPGRVIEDYVSFIDFAPTFLELAGVPEGETDMKPITGQSLTDIFYSRETGQVNPQRDHVLIGKERHDVGRPNDWGYPIRGIVTDDYLYLHNFKPKRWPAGRPETGYTGVSGSPTKTVVLESRKTPETLKYWRWSFGKRPSEELYRITFDPEALHNLARQPLYQDLKSRLRERLFSRLEAQGDPRVAGRGNVFDEYPVADESQQNFYDKFMSGKYDRTDAGWVNPSDFEPNFPDSLRGSSPRKHP